MPGPAVAIGGLLTALAEIFVPLIVKILAVRFAFKVAMVAVMAGVTLTGYFAINAIMDAVVLPSLPPAAGIAWWLINGEKLAAMVAALMGIETAVGFAMFARRNLGIIAGV